MTAPTAVVDLDNFLTVTELASLFKVPIKTVYHWASRTKIPRLKVGKHLRFNKCKVLKYFEELSNPNSKTVSCRVASNTLNSPLVDCSLKTEWTTTRTSRKV